MKVLNTVARVATYAKKRYVAQQHRKFIDNHAAELRSTPTGESRYAVALHFADDMVNAYQIRQWYEPLKNLAQHVPVVIIVRQPEAAVALHKECPLPIHFAPTIEALEQFTESQDLRLVLYVNQNIRNFQMMRFNSPNHVFICHGESDKAYMWSNQLKAYDYVFSAGQAARDRLTEHLRNFDVMDRTVLIGRPQIDVQYPVPYKINHDYPTVLYAPTWEGDRPSMAYGSVLSHGEQLVDALQNDGGFNIIFRPHPRSGMNSHAYGQALERIRNKFESSAASSTAKYIYDESAQWGWQWSAADICITDISAVAYDYLATGKPMFITEPVSREATVEDSLALTKLPAMPADEAANAAQLVRSALKTVNKESRALVHHYFGDVTPGASMKRFIDECLNLVKGTTPNKSPGHQPGSLKVHSKSEAESEHTRKTA
ncbi:CDP-glycerol glycerophosphotransferase family protein [Glutamicibacter nicotianae]|uniref:CDP-glycerol glycerophosphotransferase family protein n=1 Tax=Glutamicibacter nicotianae TaxID=37929 RepID=UPI00167F5F49|nr:CDP-glycerol glycerophosphotransferase family protein [Glutamicibacter nicotianae]